MAAAKPEVRHIILGHTLRRDALGCYQTPAPWGAIETPNLDAFAAESVRFDRAYPEALPTLCARRTLYTGLRTYPFHNGDFRHIKGDFVGIAPGWGPIPESQHTMAEICETNGFRTGLISDLYHEFKPSKNFWRGFHQWSFIRGQEADAARSGPWPTQEEIDYWVPRELQELRGKATGLEQPGFGAAWFSSRILLNMRERVREEQWFNAQVMQEAARWVEQNVDAKRASVPDRRVVRSARAVVRARALSAPLRPGDGREQVISPYAGDAVAAGRSGEAHARQLRWPGQMCDRWFGHLIEPLRACRRARPGAGNRHVRSRPQLVGAARLHRQARLSIRPRKLRAADAGAPPAKGRRRHRMQRIRAAPRHHRDDARCGRHRTAGADRRHFVLGTAFAGGAAVRDHVTIGWGSAMTVIDDQWWFNAKINGRGAFLHDSPRPTPTRRTSPNNIRMWSSGCSIWAVADAGGSFPEYLLQQAEGAGDAPGCSPFAAIANAARVRSRTIRSIAKH